MTKSAARDAAILLGLVDHRRGAARAVPRGGLWRDEASTYFEVVPNAFSRIERQFPRRTEPARILSARARLDGAGGQQPGRPQAAVYVCGLMLIVLMYLLGRRFWSPEVGWLAAAFAVVTPVALDLSAEARPYALAALLSGGYLFVLPKRRPRRRARSGRWSPSPSRALRSRTSTTPASSSSRGSPSRRRTSCGANEASERIAPFGAAFVAIACSTSPGSARCASTSRRARRGRKRARAKIVGAIQGNVPRCCR